MVGFYLCRTCLPVVPVTAQCEASYRLCRGFVGTRGFQSSLGRFRVRCRRGVFLSYPVESLLSVVLSASVQNWWGATHCCSKNVDVELPTVNAYSWTRAAERKLPLVHRWGLASLVKVERAWRSCQVPVRMRGGKCYPRHKGAWSICGWQD